MAFVLDSSVLLANLNKEPGGERLIDYLDNAVIAVTTHTEVITRLLDAGMTFEEAARLMEGFRLPTIEVSLALAKRAAELRTATRANGLSMGDRLCLATAESIDATAVTADRQWAGVNLSIAIELIR